MLIFYRRKTFIVNVLNCRFVNYAFSSLAYILIWLAHYNMRSNVFWFFWFLTCSFCVLVDIIIIILRNGCQILIIVCNSYSIHYTYIVSVPLNSTTVKHLFQINTLTGFTKYTVIILYKIHFLMLVQYTYVCFYAIGTFTYLQRLNRKNNCWWSN